MAFTDGPFLFVTDGSASSLSVLPQATRAAAALGQTLTLLFLFDEAKHPHFRGPALPVRRVERALAALPSGDAPTEVVPVHPKALLPGLLRLARERGAGTVGMRASQRSLIRRLLPRDDWEQVLRRSPWAVMPLGPRHDLAALRRVLFPADLAARSLPALDETARLCVARGATLCLLHVFGPDRSPLDADLAARRAAAPSPGALHRLDLEQLESLADRARALGVPVETATAEGRAHAAIARAAASDDISLVVMASHGPRTSEDVLFGSTTVRVAQRSPVPVLAVRTNPVATP